MFIGACRKYTAQVKMRIPIHLSGHPEFAFSSAFWQNSQCYKPE